MVCGIIITIYTLLLLVASLLYVKKRYSIEKGALTRTAFKAYWVLLAITAAVLLLFVTLSIQYSLRNELLKLPVLMRWTTLLWGLYLLAYIDYRERLIPNFLICVLLIARVAFLGCDLISDPEYWRSILLYPLIGAGIGGVILAVAMLLSRKGVGMGDVKLFITIGAYVGSMEIIATLFYTFVVSAVVGIVLLLMKKVKLRELGSHGALCVRRSGDRICVYADRRITADEEGKCKAGTDRPARIHGTGVAGASEKSDR